MSETLRVLLTQSETFTDTPVHEEIGYEGDVRTVVENTDYGNQYQGQPYHEGAYIIGVGSLTQLVYGTDETFLVREPTEFAEEKYGVDRGEFDYEVELRNTPRV